MYLGCSVPSMATEEPKTTVPPPVGSGPDYQESDKTRPSNAEDFPNFRDFQIVKMVQHFRVVTDGSQEQLRLGFKCKTCGVTFNKTMQLLGHIRLHFEDEHTCRECGKYFFDPNKLQIHIKAKHTINLLKCQLGCPRYSTGSFKCLQLHYERYHYVKIRMRELRKMDEAIQNGGTVMTQIGPQIAWPITATPITATHPQHQQILPPVHNQIEIIPLHSGSAAGATVATPQHNIITSIAPQQVQAQPQPQTLTPIQLSIKDASGNVAGNGIC
uniref:C2H2-type domain-containing protein n=1 Tax=Anopheles farauti TaxID=69004 RepID=A0A182QG77_9DIPT